MARRTYSSSKETCFSSDGGVQIRLGRTASHSEPPRVKEYVFVVPSDLIMIGEPIPHAPFENRHCFVEFPVFIERKR